MDSRPNNFTSDRTAVCHLSNQTVKSPYTYNLLDPPSVMTMPTDLVCPPVKGRDEPQPWITPQKVTSVLIPGTTSSWSEESPADRKSRIGSYPQYAAQAGVQHVCPTSCRRSKQDLVRRTSTTFDPTSCSSRSVEKHLQQNLDLRVVNLSSSSPTMVNVRSVNTTPRIRSASPRHCEARRDAPTVRTQSISAVSPIVNSNLRTSVSAYATPPHCLVPSSTPYEYREPKPSPVLALADSLSQRRVPLLQASSSTSKIPRVVVTSPQVSARLEQARNHQGSPHQRTPRFNPQAPAQIVKGAHVVQAGIASGAN